MDQIYPKRIFPVESRTGSPKTTSVCFLCTYKTSIQLLFLKILKISKISFFWTFWKKNWLCLASCALFILKLYKAFQTTVQVAMISKVMIKFRSKFQFQIPLQFYRTVEKVETCDGHGQKFWQVASSFQPFHFGYYFAFSWLRFQYTECKGTLT